MPTEENPLDWTPLANLAVVIVWGVLGIGWLAGLVSDDVFGHALLYGFGVCGLTVVVDMVHSRGKGAP
jgi:hypothetical protein